MGKQSEDILNNASKYFRPTPICTTSVHYSMEATDPKAETKKENKNNRQRTLKQALILFEFGKAERQQKIYPAFGESDGTYCAVSLSNG